MRSNTDNKKKIAPIAVTAAVVLLLAGVLLWLVFPMIRLTWGATGATAFLLVYALAVIAVIAGIVAALRQRLREIEGGEEDDAKKY